MFVLGVQEESPFSEGVQECRSTEVQTNALSSIEELSAFISFY